jgi:DNA-binding SARP family transcriptional activator/tetratricopeptide (TPR) repeat protein/DNA-binding XRE family transcriptional regulator
MSVTGTVDPVGDDADLLRRLRIRAGLSQKELAERAGLSVRTLRYLEGGGVARPQAASIRKLADALGLDPDELARLFAGVGRAEGPGSTSSGVAGSDAGVPAAGAGVGVAVGAGVAVASAPRSVEAESAGAEQVGRLRVDVLGPLVLRHGTQLVEVTSAMQRTLLALLALQHGQMVGSGEIIDLLWPDEPPRTCLQLVHTYVGQVRRLLGPDAIRRRAGGYVLDLEPDQLDLAEFDRSAEQARAAWSAGSAQSAWQFYSEAWSCWRGPLLAGFDARLRQHPAAVAVAQRRTAAALAWTDVAFGLARYEDVIGPLRVLHGEEPLHEGLAARLMLALAGSGQQAAALALFESVRDRLDVQLGVTPGPELRAAQMRVLRGQLPASAPTVASAAALPPPAQLPADVDAFTGRGAQLDTLDALLPAAGATVGPARVVALAGMGGVGKTALAVHWAHQVRSRFPDGQLYVNLRGHSGEPPLRPLDALSGFLLALGMSGDQIPDDEAQAAAIYRSRLAGKRVLVLLDNAGAADQVRPLLPTGPGSLALVTGRDRLTGLIAREGARLVPLDALAPHESVALLDHMLGPRRAAAEPDAVADLARLCAHLPLALRIAAANLAARPRHRVADYNAKLLAGDRLGALEADGDATSAVRATFELSCSALPSAERRMFRLLGTAPGPDIAIAAAAALAGIGPQEAERALDRLTGRHLVHEHVSGRYAMHDLLRLYAGELAEEEEEESERETALKDLTAYYRARVAAAAQLCSPHLLYIPAPDAPRADGVPPGVELFFSDSVEAVAWIDTELPNLVALVRELAARGHHAAVWGLSDLLSGYFVRRGNSLDWKLVAAAAYAAALADGDPIARAATSLQVAMVDIFQGRHESAAARQTETAVLAKRAGWTQCHAVVLNNLARCLWTVGMVDEPIATLTEALELHRRSGRVAGEAVTLANLGAAYADRGKEPNAGRRERDSLVLAVRYLDEALELHRRIGDRRNEGETLKVLAEALRDSGTLAAAQERAERALELARANQELRFEIGALSVLGTVHVRNGDAEQGMKEHARALELTRTVDDPRLNAETHLALADSLTRLGRLDEAQLHIDDADNLARQLRSGLIERQCRRAMATIDSVVARDVVLDAAEAEAVAPGVSSGMGPGVPSGMAPGAVVARSGLEDRAR